MDIRTKADGTTASSAGAAVREQVNSVTNRYSYLSEEIETGNIFDGITYGDGYYSNLGTLVPSATYHHA